MANHTLRITAVAAFCALPLVGNAQTRSSAPTAASPPAASSESAPPAGSSAATGAQANTNATTTSLAMGMTVKDNTGAAIGKITKLGADSSGASVATITMANGAFQAPGAALAVQDGAATINLTKAQIDAQIKGKTKS
jgi:hypothetical protein